MYNTPDLGISRQQWEEQKETIRWCYLTQGMTLKNVMQYMSQFPPFEHATANMYKKKFRIWNFDVKNHKLETIQRAAAERQKKLHHREAFVVFDIPGRKPVTEAEYRRYMQRRQERPPRANFLNRIDQSQVQAANQRPKSITNNINHWRSSVSGSQRRHATTGTLGLGRLLDIVPPDEYNRIETILFELKFCMQSSFHGNYWSVDSTGGFLSGPARELPNDEYYNQLELAYHFWQPSTISLARRLLKSSQQALQQSLSSCLPLGMHDLLRGLNWLLITVPASSSFAEIALHMVSSLVSRIEEANPSLYRLFTALGKTPMDAMNHILASCHRAWSDAVYSLDHRLASSYIWGIGEANKIDPSVGSEARLTETRAAHAWLKNSAQISRYSEAVASAVISQNYHADGDPVAAEELLIDAIASLEDPDFCYGDSYNLFCHDEQLQRLYGCLADIYEDQYNFSQAIEAKTKALGLSKSENWHTVMVMMHLADMQRAAKRQHMALEWEQKAAKLTKMLESMTIDVDNSVPFDDMLVQEEVRDESINGISLTKVENRVSEC